MRTTKTILEWLNEIEEPEIREAAIELAKKEKMPYLEYDRNSLSDAIFSAFSWCNDEKRGEDFWREYYNKLISQGK